MRRAPRVVLVATLLAACSSDSSAPAPDTAPWAALRAATTIDPEQLADYTPDLPPYLLDAIARGFENAMPATPVTDAGATVGRVLFYDRTLSTNGAVSCATCHLQANGFTDPAVFSTGVAAPAATTAHSMRLANARFYPGFAMFWDKRAPSLEEQILGPITSHVEMGFDADAGGIDAAVAALQAKAYVRELMVLGFGDSTVTARRVQLALAQFVRSIVSTGSRFDAGLAQVPDPRQPFPGFTAAENRGKQLFTDPPNQGGAGCAGCHVPPTFALAANARSNGLDAGETRVFKSPSLVNVGLGGPFMHDGRFADLTAVIEHYDHQVKQGPALDPRLVGPTGLPRQLGLSADDKAALVAFLQTLTDPTLAADARFTDPFRR